MNNIDIIDIDNSLDNILDENWINEFEEIDKNYSHFYLEDVYSLKIHYIYIDKNNNIEKIKHEKILIYKPNIVSKEEILYLLKQNCPINYSLLSILKYNIDLEINRFLTNIKYIDDIPFHQTISMLQDLNSLYFIFNEKNNEKIKNIHNKTRRLILTTTNKKITSRNK